MAEEAKKPAETPQKVAGLLKEERAFVVPGDRIVQSMEFLPGKNSFREGDSIYSKRLGLVSLNSRVVSVIPLNSVYIPTVNDMVIGEIIEVMDKGWVVEINSPYEGFIPLSGVRGYIDPEKTDMNRIYAKGDMVYGKISRFTLSGKRIDIDMQDNRARKFRGGRIINVNPAKVPRIIGRLGSMITMVKDKTGCIITAGQNGLIWLMGDRKTQAVAIEAIRTIEREAHKEGLTDRIGAMLDKLKPAAAKPAEAKPAEVKPAEKPAVAPKKEVKA